MLADSHCHLDWFKNPFPVINNALRANGIKSFFSCSTDFDSMKKHLKLFSRTPSVKIGLGLHPGDLLRLKENQAKKCLEFLEKNISRAQAVGEIGLDYKYAKTSWQKKLQEQVFRRQTELALEHGLPVAVHSRFAESRSLEVLKEAGAKKVLMHWFTNSVKSVQKASKNGFYMSAGPVIFSSSEALEVAQKIPLKRLLLETDCPVPFGGVPCEPSWVIKVGKKLAMARKISEKKLFFACSKNYSRLFSLNYHGSRDQLFQPEDEATRGV